MMPVYPGALRIARDSGVIPTARTARHHSDKE
jgi:hypothetical protein